MNKLLLTLSFISILIFPSQVLADGPYLNIPPTNAFDKINGDNGTVHAANFSMPLNIKGGSNVSIKANNSTHTITISASLASGGAGSYNTTSANNTPINLNGNILNFINGSGNPINVKNSGNKVNITISTGGGAGSILGSQNVGKGTISSGVLSTASATTIKGKNVTAGTGITVGGNSTDITITNSQTQGIVSLNFTTNNDFDFRFLPKNMSFVQLVGQIFQFNMKNNVVLTNESAQTVTKQLTLNNLILGGDENVGTNAFTILGHKSTLPSTSGVLCQTNMSGTCGTDVSSGTILGSQNVGKATGSTGVLSTASTTTIKGKNMSSTSPIVVANTNTTDITISCPTCGTLSTAITSVNSQTGPAVNVVGSNGNITITNSTNQVKINTGSDIPHLTKQNNFTKVQIINLASSGTPTIGSSDAFIVTGDSVAARNGFELYSYGSTPAVRGFRANGLQDAPTATAINDRMGQLGASGYETTTPGFGPVVGAFRILAGEAFTNTAQGTYATISTTPIGSTTLVEYLRVNPYGGIRLAAIADPTPTNNDIWISTTNTGVIKYQSGGTTYDIMSTKNAINFTASSNKTGTAGFTMLGDGVTITPALSTRAEITVSGYTTSSIAADGGAVQIRQITGGCPANAAAVTGTALGSNLKITDPATTSRTPFSITVQTTGLTIGTKYCFELTQQAITGGTFTVFNVMWSAKEI